VRGMMPPMRRWLIVVGFTAVMAAAGGCADEVGATRADGPRAAGAAAPPSCQVWHDGLFSTTTVTVRGGAVEIEGFFGPRSLAFMKPDGTIYRHGIFSPSVAGRYANGRLVIDHLLGDVASEPIGDGRVTFKGVLVDTVYHYGDSCPRWAAALGAYGLLLLAEQAAAAQQSSPPPKLRY